MQNNMLLLTLLNNSLVKARKKNITLSFKTSQVLPGGPVVKIHASNSVGTGSILHWRTKTPHAMRYAKNKTKLSSVKSLSHVQFFVTPWTNKNKAFKKTLQRMVENILPFIDPLIKLVLKKKAFHFSMNGQVSLVFYK